MALRLCASAQPLAPCSAPRQRHTLKQQQPSSGLASRRALQQPARPGQLLVARAEPTFNEGAAQVTGSAHCGREDSGSSLAFGCRRCRRRHCCLLLTEHPPLAPTHPLTQQVRRLVDRDRKELNLDELEAAFGAEPSPSAAAPVNAAAADGAVSSGGTAAAATRSLSQVNSSQAGARLAEA